MAAIGGKPAPELVFDHALGFEAATSPMTPRGRVTLLVFWATWCGACRSEVPALREFWREHSGEGDIDLIGVTRLYGDEKLDDIEAFVDEYDIPYPTLVAGKAAHVAYRVDSLPSSVLIDRNGEIVACGAGVSGTERLMREARARAGT